MLLISSTKRILRFCCCFFLSQFVMTDVSVTLLQKNKCSDQVLVCLHVLQPVSHTRFHLSISVLGAKCSVTNSSKYKDTRKAHNFIHCSSCTYVTLSSSQMS